MSSATLWSETIPSTLQISSRLMTARPARFSFFVNDSVSNECSPEVSAGRYAQTLPVIV